MSSGTGWAQLRQQIRSVESQTENLFHTYSQFAASSSLAVKPSEDEQRTEAEIHDLLEKRETLISQLARLLDSESALNTSTLKQSNLTRHREVLTEHRQELRRLKSQIAEARDRQHLLTNVRSDIDAFRASNPAEEEAEYMLQERGRLDRSHNVIDGVLSQAYAINENFGLQRETLASINRRITHAAAQLPGVNGLIQKIGAKRWRDESGNVIYFDSIDSACKRSHLWDYEMSVSQGVVSKVNFTYVEDKQSSYGSGGCIEFDVWEHSVEFYLVLKSHTSCTNSLVRIYVFDAMSSPISR